ncbi:MAG: ATP-binding protein, partial [Acidimicrobiales bacterium]
MSWEGRVFLLGAVRATHDGREAALAGAQPRLLLAYTVLQRGRVVPNDELAEVLWGGRSARHWEGALRGVVAKVRAFLSRLGPGAPTLDTVGRGYRFAVDDVSTIDVWQAERCLARAEEALALGDGASAARAAAEAARLLAAPLLVGVDADWLAPWRTCFDEDRRRAHRIESSGYLALGRHDDAIASAAAAVAEDAYDEESRRGLMAAYRAAGNRAAALRVYGDCRRRLADDLGVAPDARTEAMYVELLSDEPLAAGQPDPTVRGRASAPLSATLADHPFVGRVEALQEIDASWRSARRGRAQIVLLHGEAGVGKTRLLLEAASRAGADHVLYGRSGAEQVVPFEPFAEALGPHLDGELVEALDRHRRALAALVPGLAPEAPGDEDVDDVVDEPRVLDAVRAVIDHLATAPTILAFDDLHWADGATLRLLRRLVETVDAGALLLVCTYRDDVEPTAELAATVGAIRARDGCRVIEVDGLEPDEVTELLRATDVADADGLGPLWCDRTGGNGFYLTQVLLASVESRRFDPHAVPDTVHELVRHRVATLSSGARDVLGVAAVIGSAFPSALLTRVVREIGLPHEAVAELIERHLLIEAGDAGVGFAHAIVRDAVYEQVSPRRRRRIHQRVSEAIGALWPGDPEWAATLARHHLMADDPSRVAELVDALLAAAAHASGRHAFDHAAELSQLALVHLARLSPDEPRRAATLVALGAALHRAGDLGAAQEALETALELARASGDARVGADAVLELVARGWRGAEIGMADDDRAALLEEAAGRLRAASDPDHPDDQRRLVTLLVEQTRALMLSADGARRRQVASQAVAVAATGRRASLLAEATEAHRLVLTRPDGAAARLALTDSLVGERAGELTALQLARLRMWRLTDCVELGDRRGLDRELWALTEVVARLRHPNWDWVVASWNALLTFLGGEPDQADVEARVAIEQASGVDHLGRMLAYGSQMIGFRLQQGRGAEVVDLVRVALASSPDMVAMRCVLALALAQADALTASGPSGEAGRLVMALAADD